MNRSTMRLVTIILLVGICGLGACTSEAQPAATLTPPTAVSATALPTEAVAGTAPASVTASATQPPAIPTSSTPTVSATQVPATSPAESSTAPPTSAVSTSAPATALPAMAMPTNSTPTASATQAPATSPGASVVALRVETVASGLEIPKALAFAPDGRLFVAARPGRVRIIRDGVLLPEPAITLPDVVVGGEHGLSGMTLAPDFASSRHVYLYYTHSADGGLRNRIVRYVEGETPSPRRPR